MSHAPCGLFVYFQRTVGGKEYVFKPGQDKKNSLKLESAGATGEKTKNKSMFREKLKEKIHSSKEFSKIHHCSRFVLC